MTYEQYELFVKMHLERKLRQYFGYDIEVKHQENLSTPTGRVYNIDLNYRFRIDGIEYMTILECKNWKSTVTRDMILISKEKANDLCVHKTILVTTKGFQSGAIDYAIEKGVGLIKMTTTGKTKVFSNYIGTDISYLIDQLRVETEISDEEEITENIGVIFPTIPIENYLNNRFGQIIFETLRGYKNGLSNYKKANFDKFTLNIIKDIPPKWYKEYQDIETCGLPLSLSNERELRLYITSMFLLKSSISDNYS